MNAHLCSLIHRKTFPLDKVHHDKRTHHKAIDQFFYNFHSPMLHWSFDNLLIWRRTHVLQLPLHVPWLVPNAPLDHEAKPHSSPQDLHVGRTASWLRFLVFINKLIITLIGDLEADLRLVCALVYYSLPFKTRFRCFLNRISWHAYRNVSYISLTKAYRRVNSS